MIIRKISGRAKRMRLKAGGVRALALGRRHAVAGGAHAARVPSSPARRRHFTTDFLCTKRRDKIQARNGFGGPPNTAGQRPALPILKEPFRLRAFSLFGWVVLLAVVAVAAAGGYWYWQQKKQKAPEYKSAVVTRGDLIQVVTATGQLNPKTNVVVGSQVFGIIQKLFVDYNTPVTNGQIIAELDPATYEAIAAGARADLANSVAALELARVTLERSAVLYTNKILAQADYDTAVAGYDQAEAQVDLKKAALKQAEVNLAYTVIYSPVNGVVISRNVDVGQTVAASLSAPTLYQIANDLSKMQIDALVSEADIGGVETNQNVNFTVDAFPTRVFQGVVVQIRNAPQTNQNVITYDTVIGVDNADLKLRPGMTANVSIITAQRNNVLKIPNGALRFHPQEFAVPKTETNLATTGPGGGTHNPNAPSGSAAHKAHSGERVTHTVYVLVKTEDGKPPELKPVQVQTGINDGVFTQVTDGLNEGDEVVIGETLAAGSAPGAGGNPFGGGRRF